jgi:hypothetical protein
MATQNRDDSIAVAASGEATTAAVAKQRKEKKKTSTVVRLYSQGEATREATRDGRLSMPSKRW